MQLVQLKNFMFTLKLNTEGVWNIFSLHTPSLFCRTTFHFNCWEFSILMEFTVSVNTHQISDLVWKKRNVKYLNFYIGYILKWYFGYTWLRKNILLNSLVYLYFLNVALKYRIIYVAHLILDSADLAPLYPILFSIPSFIRKVSEGQEGESVPNSLNTKGGMAAWVTVSYGFRGSN